MVDFNHWGIALSHICCYYLHINGHSLYQNAHKNNLHTIVYNWIRRNYSNTFILGSLFCTIYIRHIHIIYLVSIIFWSYFESYMIIKVNICAKYLIQIQCFNSAPYMWPPSQILCRPWSFQCRVDQGSQQIWNIFKNFLSGDKISRWQWYWITDGCYI